MYLLLLYRIGVCVRSLSLIKKQITINLITILHFLFQYIYIRYYPTKPTQFWFFSKNC